MAFGGFGAGAAYMRYAQEKQLAAALPRRCVSHDTFVKRFLAAGLGSVDDARLAAKLTTGLGGHTRVGAEMLKVRRKAKPKA